MHCAIIIARRKSIGADLGKCGAAEVNLSAAQKCLWEVTELAVGNMDHGVCGDKITCNRQLQIFLGTPSGR